MAQRIAAPLFIAAAFLMNSGSASAMQPLPKADIPVPQQRPGQWQQAQTTNAIPFASVQKTSAPLVAQSANISALKNGLDALSRKDFANARSARDRLRAGTLDRRILTWAVAYFGGSDIPSHEIADAATKLSGWPGMDALRRNSERALYRENPPAKQVVAAFSGSTPQTTEGAILLARAHKKLGATKSAAAVIVPLWRDKKLDAKEEVAILKEFGRLIPRDAHCHRMERMMYEDRVRSAGRVAGLCKRSTLHKAWAAVIRREKNAGKLLRSVPQNQRTAGYSFAMAQHLRRSEKFADAAAVMKKTTRDPAKLIDPDAWWVERRVLSRELLDIKYPKTAYRVAANHSAESPARQADAEFHAGWYALRFLNDPATASRHFARIGEVASGPISNARSRYWLGRAAEAGRPGSSKDYYSEAARFGTTFYGQIAAAKLGRAKLSIPYPKPTAADRKNFERREAVLAIRRLAKADHRWRANAIYRGLARELTAPGELALLAVLAENQGDHDVALRVGKIAASRGLPVGALSHPLGVITGSTKLSSDGKALAYAVARQESEFNVGAVSPAGARGLMQLMPGTAKAMARHTGLGYSARKLTRDAAYNARLGTAYLTQQLARFDNSYVLTLVAYNAGPRRAENWSARYGSPEGRSIEAVVDWVERIPFTETRNYVQRVMENYQVYKARLGGRLDIKNDLTRGR